MQVIHNACVINAKMPPVEIIQSAIDKNPDLIFKPMELGTTQAVACGFVNDAESGALVTKFHGGYLLRVCIEEKIVVARQVKAEIEAKLAEIYKLRGANQPITRKEMIEIRDEVIITLTKKAPTDQSYVPILVTENFIFVGTINTFRSRRASAMLVNLVDSLTTSTIYINGFRKGITSMLKHNIDTGENIMSPFSASSYVLLKKDPMCISYNVEDLIAHGELVKNIDLGFEVEKIEIIYRDEAVQFMLNKKYQLQKIKVFGLNDDMEYVDSLNYESTLLDHMMSDFLKLFKRDDEASQESEPEKECQPA